MSRKLKVIIGLVIVALIAVMVIINLKKSRGKTIEVSTTLVERGALTKTVSGSGYIQPEIDVQISARISAEIIKIHVKEGDIVQKGQLLVELDSQVYEAVKERAQSGVLSAQASLKKAEADFRRIEDLFKQSLASQADLDAMEATKLLAQSQLRQAEASLREAQDNLNKTRLTAPMHGVVTKLNKEEGEIAVGSQFQADPVMTVSDLSRMEVLSEIDENDVVLVTLGDTTKIEVDAIPDTILDGIVSEIAHEATTRGRGTQEQVTNFEVKVAVTSKIDQLRPGMSCTVDISTETRHDVLFVPIQCVTMREDKPDSTQKNRNDGDDKKSEVVFVVTDGIASVVPVETGISDDTNIEIVSGLAEEQEVVSGSYKAISQELKDGSQVKVKKAGAENEKRTSDQERD
ncbi:efflux RND transporter periplasmic adaptor subunit [candidate division KSB1 bacterium]|nr:efflux RND transporter periplasmic adaptor subunit [candidate division KSB1 bacterium]RQW07378.1 MAG: efflux RND transporter periplasmic adaptor subunit [candidate division KSB1 bacterium]